MATFRGVTPETDRDYPNHLTTMRLDAISCMPKAGRGALGSDGPARKCLNDIDAVVFRALEAAVPGRPDIRKTLIFVEIGP